MGSSWFGNLYKGYAAPMLMSMYPQERTFFSYKIGDLLITNIVGYFRPKTVELHTDINEVRTKRTTAVLVFSTDQEGPWRGVKDPQLTGRFIVGDETWNVDPYEGSGIRQISETFVVVHLVREQGVARSYSGSHAN